MTKVTNTILSQLRDSLDSATHILQQQPSMEGIEFLKAKKKTNKKKTHTQTYLYQLRVSITSQHFWQNIVIVSDTQQLI